MSKVFVVSGAGSGIGKAICHHLAEKGNTCIMLGRDEEKLERTYQDIPNGEHLFFSADVSSFDSLMEVAEKVGEIAIDGIVANAGVGGENHYGPNDRWNEIIGTNLTGSYQLVNAFLPHLHRTESTYKYVVFISSILAKMGVPAHSAYCASKAGILGMMRAMALDYAPFNILVNAVCPGCVYTDLAHHSMKQQSEKMKISQEDFFQMAMKHVPLQKMSKPEEIADLVLYILSQHSITGQSIDINGGAFMNN